MNFKVEKNNFDPINVKKQNFCLIRMTVTVTKLLELSHCEEDS